MGPSLFSAVFHHAAAAEVGDEEIEQIDQQEDAERLNGRDEDMASSQLGDDAVDEDDPEHAVDDARLSGRMKQVRF